MTRTVQTYAYPRPSAVRAGAAASAGLLSVADVAAVRYFQPRQEALRDPVVTGNGDRLREALSRIGAADPLHLRDGRGE